MENFVDILKDYLHERTYQIGDLAEGVVVKVQNDVVFVDIGTKKEAILPKAEVTDAQGNLFFQVGERVKAQIVKRLSGEGHYLLSVKRILEEEAWNEIKEAHEKGTPLEVLLTKPIKGGFEVVYRGLITGFLPQSHLGRNISLELPQKLAVIPINFNERSYVVSHKVYQEKEREIKFKGLVKKLEEEGILEGRVKSPVKGGFILDFDGVLTGFLPLSELTRRRIKQGEIYLTEGDLIRVKVLEWDPQKRKLKVSHKALEPDPWESVESRYGLDQRVKGKVVKVENFGAFVELEPGLEGLLPASEISWKKGLKPVEVLQEGDIIDAVITELVSKERKLILSLKRLEENPWDVICKTLKIGDLVKAPIKTITDFGLFVEVKEGVDGFIHISQVSWDRVKDLRTIFKEGDEVTAKVIELSPENKKLVLSIKELQPDPWKEFSLRHKPGDVVEGEVKKEIPGKGYLVKVGKGVLGFLPLRELAHEKKKTLSEGQSFRGKIILLDLEQRKLWISEKAYILEEEQREVEAFKDQRKPLKRTLKLKIEDRD
ncbi:MAG: S1 RNA-binding domain-containing protein [Caldimicrobium sp.]|nr:S1 RNA-binding domain-containing protein [Caldimicrobium sp.]MCX7612774.1 S1 RNA-binding domain-containing protein [Caldimicrobium sp.]MDW8182126.1 S1 RNA-binding domain-containing protein [Caldimicrobium sp.]